MSLIELVQFFEEPVFNERDSRSPGDQVKSGLRLGFGCGFFLIGIMLLGSSLKRLGSTAPLAHHPGWSDWMGWMEFGGAILLLIASAHIWHWLLGGVTLAAFVKSVFFLIFMALSGAHAPRGQALSLVEIAAFSLATMALLFRFINTRLTLVDRIALTLFMIASLWGVWRGLTLAGASISLAILAISWCLDRWRKLHEAQKSVKLTVS